MASFIHGLNLLLFFFFCIYPLVFCQLSSNQTTVMVGVSQLLRNETSSWSDTNQTNPCRWKGVICNSPLNNSITSVSLRGFGLFNSSFLTLLCQIDSLQYLDFSNNMFVSIPDGFFTACGGIDGLKVLNFSRNMLNGPLPTFHNFVGLESLDLSFNALNGEIESQLDDLSSLKSLNLSFNNFSGSVPIPLGKSRVLERLELSENRFIGEISGDIEMYGNLIYIDLSGNKLSGKVPVSIGNLTKLEFLILSSNRLSGEIPETILNISTLQRFSANQNSFSGSISGSIHGDITRSLKILDLSFNHLTGKIPSQFLSSSNLQTVDLSYNKLDGPIPEKISQGLIRLRLGSNLLSGSIPSVAFDSLNNLMYLELDNNSLTGSIPPKIGSCKNLALLNLAGNKLSGTLPGELLNLTRLQVLKLQLNKFDGEIPSGIGQLNMLTTFNISGNSLRGIIPPSIVNCGKLSNLILQGNILSGSIPGDINRLSNLVELQLGENKLNGRIPEMPSKLQICLDLSGNLFEGTIPKTLSGLPSLEILDLSNNRFSGEVPEFLTQLSSLTQLILSNNQLSGVLPKFNPHVSVNYNGTQVTPAEENHQPSSKNGKSITITVVITVSAAVIAVGVVAVVSLLISRRFYKVNDEQPQSWEVLSPPRVLQGNLLTSNGIHRSNIDFAKAMQVVANPANIALKTRFSIYYKAIMPSGASYYVKKLNWSDKIFQLGSHDKFERELVALGKLSNSNVMIPLAYVLTVDSAYLFYEFAPKGTLYDVLHGSQKTSLDWASRYSIAVGVAQGLAFLHGCASSPILLLDLSTKNIVLKSLKEPQVGDIELCKVIDPSKSTGSLSTVAGSVGYIPPEYAYTMRVTMAGNVYSFGVVLLELLTGKPAVTQGTELAKWVLSNSAHTDKRDHILDFSISRTSQVIRNQMLAVLKVALACVNVSPEARPKMKSVIRMLLMQDKSSVTI